MRKFIGSALVVSHPITLAVAVLAMTAVVLAVVAVLALLAALFYLSVAYLLAMWVRDELFKGYRPHHVPTTVEDEPVPLTLDELPEADPLKGWVFTPIEQEEQVAVACCEPQPVLVCSTDDALDIMDGTKSREEVQFAPMVVTQKPKRTPSKKRLLAMSDDELRQVAKDLGCKGISLRMKRDTVLWRITTAKPH